MAVYKRGIDGNLTITRDGNVYGGFGPAGGTPGFTPSVRAGWLNQTGDPENCKIDQFAQGWNTTVSGQIPVLGPIGPSVGETEGYPGTATSRRRAFPRGRIVGKLLLEAAMDGPRMVMAVAVTWPL